MSNTISLEELKNLSLPCLPKNLESIRYRAKTQDWPYIEEVGKARGGRLKKILNRFPSCRNPSSHHETAVGRAGREDAENAAPSQTGDGDVGSGTG